MCMISLIVFTDKYLGHVWTFYTNGISLHFNYIQILLLAKDSPHPGESQLILCYHGAGGTTNTLLERD